MATIYELQQRADALRKKTATDSISPEEVGGLHADTLAYIANMERYASSLGIKKVYTSVSEMNGDESPVSSTGMPLKAGQLVTIFNAEAPDAENSGEIYAFQNPGWVLVGRLYAGTADTLKKLIEGDKATVTNNNRNAFVWLGNFETWAEAQTEIDKLHATGEDNTKVGEFRLLLNGRNLIVRNFVQNWATGVFTQTIQGSIQWNVETQTMDQSLKIKTYERRYNEGTGWTTWEEGAAKIELAQGLSTEEGSENNAISQKAVSYAILDCNEPIDVLKKYTSINPISWVRGAKIRSYASVGSVSPMTVEADKNYMYAIIDCKKGDVFYFSNIQGSAYYRTYVVIDASNNVLADGGLSIISDKDVVIQQDEANRIVINNSTEDGYVLYGSKNDIAFNKTNDALDVIKKDIDLNVVTLNEGGLINNYSSIGEKPSLAVKSDNNSNYVITDCAEGDVFKICGGYNQSYYKLFSFLDAEGNTLALQLSNSNIYQNGNIIVKAPANATQLTCNLYKDGYVVQISDTEYSLSNDLKSLYDCEELEPNTVTDSMYITINGLQGKDGLFSCNHYNLHEITNYVCKVLVEIENDNAIDGYVDYAVTGLTWNAGQMFLKGDNCKVGKYQVVIDVNVNNPAIVLRIAYSKSCKVYLINDKINRDDVFSHDMAQMPMGTGIDYETLSTEYDYSAIMVTGQSLSVGTANSGNVDFTAVDGCYMLGGVSVEGDVSSELLPLKVVGETDSLFPITVTLCNSLKKMLNNTRFKDVKLISLPIGIGGVPISAFEPDGSPGKTLISSTFSKLKEAVADKKVNIIGVIWMQGENDSNTEVERYYNSLLNVKNWIQDKAVEVFGQKNKPLFFTYQTGAGYSNRQSIAQFNCAKNNEDTILLNPSHIMWAGTGGTHPNVNGYRMYGEITALQFKRIFLDGYKATAVYPKTIRVDKEFVYIDCIVPVPPLRINTKTLFSTKTSIGNDYYGFILYDKDNSRYISIKSISIVGGCTIKLTTYGDLTGINLSVRFLNTGFGGRGVICDSQETPTVSKYVANNDIAVENEDATDIYGNSLVGKSYPTYNWLNQFELDVDNNTIPAIL